MNSSSRAKAKYNKSHYDAIHFQASKGTKQALKEASQLENISVTKLIMTALVYYIGNVVLPKHNIQIESQSAQFGQERQ